MDQYEPRISNILAVGLIFVAVLVDLTQLFFTLLGFIILGVALNSLISIFAAAFFGIVLKLNGVSLLSARRATLTLLTLVGETIPIGNNVPIWTLSIVTGIVMTRREDRQIFEEKQKEEAREQPIRVKVAANDNQRRVRYRKRA